MDDAPAMGIGRAAERTGLSVHTLRFYEKEGLLPWPVRRDPAGRRAYGATDLEWFAVCSSLRASGMPLPRIRRYAELVRAGEGTEAERLELLRGHRDDVRARIAELEGALSLIEYKVGFYADRIADGTAARVWTGQPTEE